MKAAVFKTSGGPEVIQLVDRELPVMGEQEVLIRVKAAGINRPDVMQREGMYDPPPGVTDIPGLEVAGEIVQLGNPRLPFHINEPVCAIIPGGGYAEYVNVPATNVAKLPTGLSFEEGGGLMETFLTVWSHLFKFAGFKGGKSILIHGGASGIGTTATMLTKAFGATQIYATVSNGPDQQASQKLGATIAINYKTQDFVKEVLEHTHGKGVDYILDIIGGDYVQRNYEVAALYGTILQVGVIKGNAKDLNLFPMLAKRLTHQGITLRAQSVEDKAALLKELVQQVWPLLEEGSIKPLIHRTFPLSQVREAHRAFDKGGHFGKLVLLA